MQSVRHSACNQGGGASAVTLSWKADLITGADCITFERPLRPVSFSAALSLS